MPSVVVPTVVHGAFGHALSGGGIHISGGALYEIGGGGNGGGAFFGCMFTKTLACARMAEYYMLMMMLMMMVAVTMTMAMLMMLVMTMVAKARAMPQIFNVELALYCCVLYW